MNDHKIDIREDAKDLVYLLDRIFSGYGYRDSTGEIKVWHENEIDELARKLKMKHPSHLMDLDLEEMLPEFQDYDFEIGFLDYLNDQLYHEVVGDKFGNVVGWNIEITVGGPTVYLRKDAFSTLAVFYHSWGVEETRIELNSATGIYVTNEITEIFNDVFCTKTF